MDALLKPILSLLPARKAAMKHGKQAAPTGPAASMHHLLYAMRDLNPRFVAIAADLRVERWPVGTTERPQIDAHVPEELLLRQRDEAEEEAERAAKERRRRIREAKKRKRGERAEARKKQRERRREAAALGIPFDEEAIPPASAAAADDDDDDGAAVADPQKAEAEAREAKKRAKERKKKQKGQVTWGLCLTHKGTLTFVNPDGLTKLAATVNRRDMERIEVCGARHCVDAMFKGARVTIVWTLPTNEIQRSTKARDRFKAVAAEILPDVDYADVTPPDPDSSGDDDEEEDDEDDDDDDKGPPTVADDDRGGGENTPAVADGAFEDDEDEYETASSEETAETASTEYEEREESEPDEEPIDIAATVRELQHARDVSAETSRRIFAAQKWLADNPLQTGNTASSAVAARLNLPEPSSPGSGSTSDAPAAPKDLTGRERALRLALLVNLICDKQRALAAVARASAGDHSMRARYLLSASSASAARLEQSRWADGGDGGGPSPSRF